MWHLRGKTAHSAIWYIYLSDSAGSLAWSRPTEAHVSDRAPGDSGATVSVLERKMAAAVHLEIATGARRIDVIDFLPSGAARRRPRASVCGPFLWAGSCRRTPQPTSPGHRGSPPDLTPETAPPHVPFFFKQWGGVRGMRCRVIVRSRAACFRSFPSCAGASFAIL
jgi:hypothetical protein